MKYFDTYGAIVASNGDGGDSAQYTSICIATTGFNHSRVLMFVIGDKIIRHPFPAVHPDYAVKPPWTNPGNTSRDQTSPVVAVLVKHKYRLVCKKILFATLKRLCFAQNFERDAKGTTKFPWPHYAHRIMDRPWEKKPWNHNWPSWTKVLLPIFKALKIVKQEVGGEWVYFDFADPLPPHHVIAMALGAYPRYKKLWVTLAKPFFILEALTYRWSDNDDQQAIIMNAWALDMIPLYKKIVPTWEKKCRDYWNPRGFHKIGEEMVEWLSKY